jgi:LysM repeat protein
MINHENITIRIKQARRERVALTTVTSVHWGGHDLKNLGFSIFVTAMVLSAGLVQAQTLKGSSTSIENQYRAAQSYGYTFVNHARSVKEYIGPGQLVKVNPDRYMELHAVSFPYAREGTKLFLNRLSAQYYSACGEKLTVTSLLRPRDRQPANSVSRSVHPTGMAIDLRIPSKSRCRSWLENTLLSLEKERVLDVTRERYPPHYHVAVFVKKYETRVAAMTGTPLPSSVAGINQAYVVRQGDTLSEIAARTGVGIAQLRAANGLRGNLIYIGQKLQVPVTGAGRGTLAHAGDSVDLSTSEVITHKVNRGDTLWRIANRYGTSVQRLRKANGKTGDALQVGQVLTISKG